MFPYLTNCSEQPAISNEPFTDAPIPCVPNTVLTAGGARDERQRVSTTTGEAAALQSL